MCTVHRPPHGRSRKARPVDGDDKMTGQRHGLFFHYFIINTARGCRGTRSYLESENTGRHLERKTCEGRREGGVRVRRENVPLRQTAVMQLNRELSVFWQTPGCSSDDWVSAYWAFSASQQESTICTRRKIVPLNTFYWLKFSTWTLSSLAQSLSGSRSFPRLRCGSGGRKHLLSCFRWLSFCLNH